MAKEIIHLLLPLTDRHRPFTVFSDWLCLSKHALSRLHASMDAGDSPEIQAEFDRARSRYGKAGVDAMSRALALLLHESSSRYVDTVGDVYMGLEIGSTQSGQYFTPWEVCRLMASLSAGSPEQVLGRIEEAINNNHIAQALLLAGMVLDQQEVLPFFLGTVLPEVIDQIEPVKILDPACGSGRMLLAAAERYPGWMVQAGLVQFFGQDIDPACIAMAQVNCQLYGLRGHKATADQLRATLPRSPRPLSIQEAKGPSTGAQLHLFDFNPIQQP
jgi:hypothetical protein